MNKTKYWAGEVAEETENFQVWIQVEEHPWEPDWEFIRSVCAPVKAFRRNNYTHLANSKEWRGRMAYYRIQVHFDGYGNASYSRIKPGFMTDDTWDDMELVFWTTREDAESLLGEGCESETIWEALEAEAKAWCAYWSGEVYLWEVKAKDQDDEDAVAQEWIVGGYYGEDEFEYMVSEGLYHARLAEEALREKKVSETDDWRDVPEAEIALLTG